MLYGFKLCAISALGGAQSANLLEIPELYFDLIYVRNNRQRYRRYYSWESALLF